MLPELYILKGKVTLILQIKNEVYSSSASLQMNRVMLSSEVQNSLSVGLFVNKSRTVLELRHALASEPPNVNFLQINQPPVAPRM